MADTPTVVTETPVSATAGEGQITPAVEGAGTVKPEAEAKGEEGKTALTSKDSKTDKDSGGAPEKYEAFKLPEGVTINEPVMAEFQGVAKDMGLSQEGAQKLIDFHAKTLQDFAKATGEEQEKAWKAVTDGWLEEAKNDKDFGGDKFNENVAVAKKALDAFDPLGQGKTSPLREMLDATGAGNNPALLKFLKAVGTAVGNDKIHVGSATSSDGVKPVEQRLFPTHTQQAAE